ncbi:hypothetical protein KHA80_02175 [Anaerobacillus sp. HL2]|nr:hypothetical protein KHA80_02175 [Anaerobacillus sp. HL2]
MDENDALEHKPKVIAAMEKPFINSKVKIKTFIEEACKNNIERIVKNSGFDFRWH